MYFTDLLNDYYKKNPPNAVFDDEGIFHFKEVPLPAKYKKCPCKCGIIHADDIPTWYHSCLKMSADESVPQNVLKKCKSCHEILILELAEPLENNNSSSD